jgi:ATP-dependent helicase HrpA
MSTRDDLAARLADLTINDEHRLRRRLARLRGDHDLAEVEKEIEAAERRVARRRAAVPVPHYPDDLPIVERRADILAAIRDHQVVVVAGETGSGKTTQIPKMCLELGLGVRGRIGHTQPRRIAARTVAERIAEELGTPLGQTVGYAVRFSDHVSETTLVKLMTDGILLAELHRDRLLTGYDTIIVDEAHERSLNIDFLLGYLKDLLRNRPDLKLIITSATIDTSRFAQHFGDAPIVEVSGRTYPVELRYRPIDDDSDQVQSIVDAVAELSREGPGDVLVFLSGERDIRDTNDALSRALAGQPVEILPLYARLSSAEQHRVFAPHRGRRIVLATNVAETSLTVAGIRYVVDPGNARISRFNRRTKVQRLPIESVSQASANQRAGRCGRVAPGICIRLYSEEDFDARPEFTEPEILRTNLASVILQMADLDLGDIVSFPFVDPPDRRAVRDGIALLDEIGALAPANEDGRVRLTPVGRQLARLPVDPRFGRMLLEAAREGALAEMLVITAGLSIQDPRERPVDDREAAAASHARFADPRSDFLSILRLWDYLQDRQAELTSNQFRRTCRAEFLNFLRVREWQDLHSQLRRSAQEVGLAVEPTQTSRSKQSRPQPPATPQRQPQKLHQPSASQPTAEPQALPDAIHRAALAGLLSHIGARDPEKAEYRGARDSRFAIAPGSSLAKNGPRWLVAAELVETNRTWGRVAAPIDPLWAERLGAHLVTRSYGDPRWDPQRAAAVTDERVSLYGLVLVAARRIDYNRVDPEMAREMFIHHALVEGDWRTNHSFRERNRRLIEQVGDLEVRARRPLLIDEEAIEGFYTERVGDQVTSGRQFDRWWNVVRGHQPGLLDLSFGQLLLPDAHVAGPDDFPDTWHADGTELDLTYIFDPGAPDDGVQVEVPLVLLNQLHESSFDWQVPGHRQELVTALIRSLPRRWRTDFVPATEFAQGFLAQTGPDDGPLLPSLERYLGVPSGSLDIDTIPPHLRMTFQLVRADGTTVDQSKEFGALRRRWHELAQAEIARAAGSIQRRGQRAWTFGTVSRQVTATWRGHPIPAYPALVDEGSSVGLSAWATELEQRREMWAGTSRLLSLVVGVPAKQLERRLGNQTTLALGRSGYGSVADLVDDCATAAFDRALDLHGGPVWDEAAFAKLAEAVRNDVVSIAEAVISFAGGILTAATHVQGRLDRLVAPTLEPARQDMVDQLARLVRPRFVQTTGAARLPDLLRYVRAIDRRLDKLSEDPARDRARMQRIQQLAEECDTATRANTGAAGAVVAGEKVRWMIEELRVSTFAQVLGTPAPISEPRVRRAIEAIGS